MIGTQAKLEMGEGRSPGASLAPAFRIDNRARLRKEIITLVCVYLVLAVVGFRADSYVRLTNVQFLIPVTMAVGLSLMWGQCGILSFGQSLFYGLGGYAYGVVAINFSGADGTTNLALMAGILVPAVAALVVGWFVFYGRMSSVYVAIVMFVLTVAAYSFMAQTADAKWHIGKAFLGGTNGLGSSNGAVTPPPSLKLGSAFSPMDLTNDSVGFFLLVLTLTFLAVAVARIVVLSRWGLILRVIRENPMRAEAMGYDPRFHKMIAFVLGGAMAGISGVMFVSWSNFITPDVFGVTAAILPVLWVTVGGVQSIVGSAIAAAALSWFALYLGTQGNLSNLVVGGLLIMVAVIAPRGIGPLVGNTLARLRRVPDVSDPAEVDDGRGCDQGGSARHASVAQVSKPKHVPMSAACALSASALRVQGVAKSWRGVRALNGVSFEVRDREIVCIIGPNGAGKSTLLKCITGDVTPDVGKVFYEGVDVSSVARFQRARLGVAIKYQNGGVCPALPVIENLALSTYSPARSRAAVKGIARAEAGTVLPDPIRRLVIDRRYSPLGDLAHGSQQLVDIGMALECLPRVLVLDEPVAGLSTAETADIAELVRNVVNCLGISVLVIEHDMEFVKMLNARIVVLHQGAVLATGSYEEMMNNPEVKRVYLGVQ